MNTTTPTPKSGPKTIGDTPEWAMLVDAEVSRRKRWDQLRKLGWFYAEEVEQRTGWTRSSVISWIRTMGFKREIVYNPDTQRTSTLYDPKSAKKRPK